MTQPTSQLICGDAVEKMRGIPEASVHAVVTDPPAGIAFMNLNWDRDRGGRDAWIEWMTGVMQECLRVLKPGGHALVWALPRTSHWTATAVENAGFEIKDIVMHVFGSGFPKSTNVSKKIDQAIIRRSAVEAVQAAGLKLPSNSRWDWTIGEHSPGNKWWDEFKRWIPSLTDEERSSIEGEIVLRVKKTAGWFTSRDIYEVHAPATEDAKRWDGWGSALKPAAEHWILARKKMDGTLAANTLEHGVGGINVDGCRVATEEKWAHGGNSKEALDRQIIRQGGHRSPAEGHPSGRWPPHLALSHSEGCQPIGTRKVKGRQINRWKDGAKPFGGGAGHPYESEQLPDDEVLAWECVEGCPVRELDRQSGTTSVTGKRSAKSQKAKVIGTNWGTDNHHSKEYPGDTGSASRFFPCFKYQAKPSTAEKEAGCEHLEGGNSHKTVKSVALMRWLSKLVCPPNGTILDPFLGSGTTGIAAHLEGFNFIGIEKDEAYMEIAKARIAHHRRQLKLL